MTDFTLKFEVPASASADEDKTTLYWPPSGPGSFNTPLGPRLGRLGPVAERNVDLVRIAAVVYAADRSVPRAIGRKLNWTSRPLRLSVPVSDPDAWGAVADDLAQLLDFLSGDTWEISFRRLRVPREAISDNEHPEAARVVLLSGGADSAVGAFLARLEPQEHILFSHIGASSISPVQKAAANRIAELLPDGSTQHHVQTFFTRVQKQPGGYKFRNEFSTRTRSILFLALGLAKAALLHEAWMDWSATRRSA